MVYSLVPAEIAHNLTPWLELYIPVPSPLPWEHLTTAIIGTD